MAWNERDEKGQGGGIEYVFSVYSAKAGYTEYNDGKTCLLILEGEKEFVNGRIMDDHMWISTPAGWTCTDDGSFFVWEDDPEVRFSGNSKMQKFIKSAINAGVPIRERTDNSLDTRGWAGLKFRVKEEEMTFTDRDTKETRTYSQPLVTEYLGEVQVNTSTPTAVPTASANGGGGSDDLMSRAKTIAAECSDIIAYMDRGSKELGLPLSHALLTEEFFEQARS